MVVIVAQLSYIEHGSQEVLMAATAFVRARIDETLKDEAAAVLAELGLTVSDVVRMTLTRVAKDHALPFEMKVPNAEKRAAIESCRATMKARRARFTDPTELFDALDQEARQPSAGFITQEGNLRTRVPHRLECAVRSAKRR